HHETSTWPPAVGLQRREPVVADPSHRAAWQREHTSALLDPPVLAREELRLEQVLLSRDPGAEHDIPLCRLGRAAHVAEPATRDRETMERGDARRGFPAPGPGPQRVSPVQRPECLGQMAQCPAELWIEGDGRLEPVNGLGELVAVPENVPRLVEGV